MIKLFCQCHYCENVGFLLSKLSYPVVVTSHVLITLAMPFPSVTSDKINRAIPQNGSYHSEKFQYRKDNRSKICLRYDKEVFDL